jgi:hypothetical protein
MDPIIAWAVAFMIAVAPPGRAGTKETREEGAARYREIATAAAIVAYDTDTPPLFEGRNGRARTLALLLSVAFHESGFLRHVDFGIGPRARGDSGQSWCLMQIKVGMGRTIQGWSGTDLVANRQRCFRAGLEMMRWSFQACRDNPSMELLDAYTSGRCDHGKIESRKRMESALDWFEDHPPPVLPLPGSTTAAGRAPGGRPAGASELARE